MMLGMVYLAAPFAARALPILFDSRQYTFYGKCRKPSVNNLYSLIPFRRLATVYCGLLLRCTLYEYSYTLTFGTVSSGIVSDYLDYVRFDKTRRIGHRNCIRNDDHTAGKDG